MISDNFFKSENEGFITQVLSACMIYSNWNSSFPAEEEINNYIEYVDAYAALEAYLLMNDYDFKKIEFSEVLENNLTAIQSFFITIKEIFKNKYNARIAESTINDARNKYKQQFDMGFLYRFSDGDITRIQELLNELRNMISTSTDFEAKHKERLLSRLEGLQKELHKKMSSLDKFWGLVGDAGVVIGKFGRDAKPFVDRIREITQIIWQIQARAEELPSNTMMPQLTDNIPKTE
jgi:hypothetical protein